jgi:hypothetical protein
LLSVNTRFLGTNADSMLILESTATTDSRMTGTLAITTTGGLVVFDVDWPLTPAP